MQDIAGVSFHHASVGDWQKLYFCAPPGGKQCGTPPCQCSNPPCNICYNGGATQSGGGGGAAKGCGADPNSISCKPPEKALDYNGRAWDPMSVPGYGPFHVFAIGGLASIKNTPVSLTLNPCQSVLKTTSLDNSKSLSLQNTTQVILKIIQKSQFLMDF